MTQREKTLAMGLVLVIGLAVCGAALFFLALQPYQEASNRESRAAAQLQEEETKLAAERSQIDAIFKVDPRLVQWNEISLPPMPKPKAGQSKDDVKTSHLRNVNVDYERYLHEMLRNNRFKADSISVQMAQVEKLAVAKGKQATYERVAFRIAGRGELSSVTGFTEEFHKAPLLHQLRVLTVEVAGNKGTMKAAEGELEMKATVEALLVTGAKERTTLLPSKLPFPLRTMAEPPRNYLAMSSKNMFFGIKPPPPKPPDRKPPEKDKKETTPPPPKRKSEDPADVLAFVKLTMLCYDSDSDRWYATVYDQGKGGAEKKLSKALDELTIYDKYDSPALDATVVHVDGKQLVFKVERDKRTAYYRLKIGEMIYPIYPKQPMSRSDLKELGIKAD